MSSSKFDLEWINKFVYQNCLQTVASIDSNWGSSILNEYSFS